MKKSVPHAPKPASLPRLILAAKSWSLLPILVKMWVNVYVLYRNGKDFRVI